MNSQSRSVQIKSLNDSLAHLQVNTPGYEVYNNRLKEENKIQKRLLSENSSFHKEIENSKKAIIQDRESLKKNLVETEYQIRQIESQQVIVNWRKD